MRRSRLVKGAAIAALAIGAAVIPSCFQVAGYGDFTFVTPFREKLETNRLGKLDLLLVVDNSQSLADKQAALESTLTAFLKTLTNPPCLDGSGTAVANQPVSGTDACPSGSARRFAPVVDMHIGVITTSLGGHGGGLCEQNAEQNGKAHLQPGTLGATYSGQGFLAWDPEHQLNPPGIDQYGTLATDLFDIISSVGTNGCGLEAPLESWYRFLVDPNPYDTIDASSGSLVFVGTDSEVLDERSKFLRDDSLVAIVVLSDEDDCSFRDTNDSRFGAGLDPLPPGRAICKTSPGDPCCTSCSQPAPPGCDTTNDGCNDPFTDSINLRCIEQKRRYGFDFLQPIDRYTAGLTSSQVVDRDGNTADNPLLAARDPALVVFTAIVGVPWQDIARKNADGVPDLNAGLDAAGDPRGGFKNASELAHDGVYPTLIGDPANYVEPTDPFMIPSEAVRSGTDPISGIAITYPPEQNPINTFDFDAPTGIGIQYTCDFPLEKPETCAAGTPDCECTAAGPPDPLCNGDVRVRSGAYPAIRTLDLVSRLGAQGTVGSACSLDLDPAHADTLAYGYMAAFVGGVADRLEAPLRDQLCIDKPIVVDASGHIDCKLIEAANAPPGACDCSLGARKAPGDADKDAIDRVKTDPAFATEQWNCFCLIDQVSSDTDTKACESYLSEPVVNEFGQRVDGWCYLDATTTPPVGDPALVAACPADRRRVLRPVGAAQPRPDTTLFLDCQ